MELGRVLQEKVAEAREELSRTGRLVLRSPGLVYGAECLIRFLLGGLLAGAEIFDGWSPFGLAVVGASGAGIGGLFALLGAGLGYLAFRGLVGGLRYVATAILIFSLSFAFYDLPFYRKAWFMPLSTAVLSGITGIVYLADGGWQVTEVIFFLTELALTGLACHCYQLLFFAWETREEVVPMTQGQRLSLGFLAAGLLIALTQFTLLDDLISVGRLVAVLAVLVLAYEGGGTIGAATGLMAGLCADLAGGQLGPCTVAFGLSGLMAGLFTGGVRLLPALAYTLTNGIAVLWNWESGLYLALLYEAFTAAVLFILTPNSILRQVSTLLEREEGGQQSRKQLEQANLQLEATAQVFGALHKTVEQALCRGTLVLGQESGIFDQAAQQICASCPRQGSCWEQEYSDTVQALKQALPRMLERGSGSPVDFPPTFISRCIQFPVFLASANQELSSLLCRRQSQVELGESRSATCRQYGLLAQLLQQVARQISRPLVTDTKGEQLVKHHLAALGLQGEVWVYRNHRGHLRVEVEGRHLDVLMERSQRRILAAKLGVGLRPPMPEESRRGDKLVFVQAEPLVALMAQASQQKEGEQVNGDRGDWLRTGDGYLYLMLCDGMGSGSQACRESDQVLILLEGFLRAGIEVPCALRTLNGAMALQGEVEGGFTTLDLLQLDLFTGEGLLYKMGAAPTYIRQGEEVQQISGSAFPLGLVEDGQIEPDVTQMVFSPGDMLLLVSDGMICDDQEDLRLRTALASFEEANPRAFAQQLIDRQEGTCGADDRTVLVLQLKGR